jgi:hypothetical protein
MIKSTSAELSIAKVTAQAGTELAAHYTSVLDGGETIFQGAGPINREAFSCVEIEFIAITDEASGADGSLVYRVTNTVGADARDVRIDTKPGERVSTLVDVQGAGQVVLGPHFEGAARIDQTIANELAVGVPHALGRLVITAVGDFTMVPTS